MKKYAIIIEKAENNYAAYVPDVPGCIATGYTLEEVKNEIKEALEFHFEGMLEDGDTIPYPASICDYVDVEVEVSILSGGGFMSTDC